MLNYGFVKCAIATFNSALSNPNEATEKMKDLLRQASSKEVKLLVFPELSLTGYTCQDLFGFPQLMKSTMAYLKNLKSFSVGYDIVFIVGAPLIVSDSLYNCAFVIYNGKIYGIVPKQYLPDSNQSYERRVFTPYTDDSITSIHLFNEDIPFGNLIFESNLGYRLGIEIGEDLEAIIPPSSYLALAGANIIANPSASFELVGKDAFRRRLIKAQSSRTISAYLYTSVGFSESTSDQVFGGCGYAFENGEQLAEITRFSLEDQLEVFDVDVNDLNTQRMSNKLFNESKRNLSTSYRVINISQNYYPNFNYLPDHFVDSMPFVYEDTDCHEIFSILSTGLARRLRAINNEKVTIGISGGSDSTLALLVCVEAFKKLGLNNSGIIGITMPGFGTTNQTYSNAKKLCEALGINLREIPIKDACLQHFKDIGHDPCVHDTTYENAQARERTQILMDIANKEHGLLIGTGDLSEAALGWCTYNGDHMSMYNVNCSIPKTLVTRLIGWYAYHKNTNPALLEPLRAVIDTPISPELLPTDGKQVVQKTEITVGPYEVIDFFIYNRLGKKFDDDKILHLAKIAFKGKYSPEELRRYYKNFVTRFFRNQFKRNCTPDGPSALPISLSPRGAFMMPSDADVSAWL